MRYSFAFVLLLACASPSHAQVVEVHGGSSTLFDSNGGEIEIKANSYDAALGAGTIGPHFMAGANLTRRFERSTLTFGTQNIAFNLPTDIFDSGHSLSVLGASLRQALPSASLLIFGGMTSQNFESPFFQGTQGEEPAAILAFDGRVASTLSVASRMIVSNQITIIQGVGWRPAPWAQLAASAGVGSGKAYAATSAKVKVSIFDMQAAYIKADPGFRRVSVANVLTAEPDHLNVSLTVKPNSRFSATIGHSHYLVPGTDTSLDSHSSIDQIETNTELKEVSLSASLFRSTYSTGDNKAFVLSASRAFGPRIHAQGTYLYSVSNENEPVSSIISNVTETLTPRWTLSEIFNVANGQFTQGFGTSFLSNLATVSADYETYYVPEHLPNAFEQVLILNAELNLFGRATLRGGTFVAPNGSVKHTVSASGVYAHNHENLPANEHDPLDRYVIIGRVVDQLNRPVEGAALLVDRIPIYTDSEGKFILREHQSRFHELQVLPRQFLDGGEYMIVNATHNIRSTLPDDAVMTTIVVQRIPQQVGPACSHGAPCKS